MKQPGYRWGMGAQDGGARSRRLWWLSAMAIALSLVVIYSKVVRVDQTLREELLREARLLAEAVDRPMVSALRGVPGDAEGEAFRRLHALLARFRTTGGYRFIYLLGRRADPATPDRTEVIFLLDAQDESREATPPSAPGDVYADASPELTAAFDRGGAFVEGPLPDEWGVWVSALVPLTDPRDGRVRAVLGVDIDARDWRRRVAGRVAVPAGLLLALLAVVLGIEAGRRTRDLVRDNEFIQRSLLDSIDAGVVVIDPATHVIERVNLRAADMFGSAPEEIVGNMCHRFLCPAEQGRCPITDGGQSVENSERIMLRADGTRVPIMKSIRRIRMQGRDKLLETFIDISELKRAQADLVSEARLRDVLVKLSTTYISLPLDRVHQDIKGSLGELGGFVGADRVYLFDYDFDQQICVNTHEWCAEGIAPQIDELQAVPFAMVPDWVEAHRRGETMHVPDVFALPTDSGIRQVLEPQGIRSLIAVPMMDGAHCLGFAGFDSVRSHHRYTEAEQRLLSVFAQMLVNVRRRRTTEEALRRSQTEAEAATRAKSEFLANLSHEIRTPMNGVLGTLNLLMDTPLADNQRRLAETALGSADSLLALLNDILDFSKMEAGRLELERLDFSLRQTMDEAVAPLALRAQERGVEFVCAAAPDVPDRLRGDPTRLRQVLVNLAGNAVKFTERGEIELRVELVGERDHRLELRFTVRDTGVGISTEQSSRLFTQFSQVDASTTRRYGGTGLGLAIAKQLSEMMDGDIGVESEPGRGSVFWFTARFEPGGPVEEMSPNAPADGGVIQGARILIVDDNETNRQVLATQLQAWGARVDAAADGPEALHQLRQALLAGDAFSAAVVDMQMPGMDGIALARVVRSDPSFSRVRLVLLTSIGHLGDIARIRDAGFSGWLTKPARQADLYRSVASALSGRPPPAPAAPAGTSPEPRFSVDRRVLVVEDNPVNRLVALGMLQKFGVHAEVADSGAAALEALGRDRYDLVLMDVQMPGMDGFETTRRIRDAASGVRDRRVRIVAMTAHALRGDRERCLAAGMDDYLPKPVSRQALANVLVKWLPSD